MQNYLNIKLVALLSVIVVASCDMIESSIYQQYLPGSLSGYHHCVNQERTEHLNVETVNRFCRNKNETEVNVNIDGRGYYTDSCETYSAGCGQRFQANIKNQESNYIITRLVIEINHADAESSDICQIDDLWLEPEYSKTINCYELVYFPQENNNQNSEEENDYTWNIINSYAIKIDL